jgi:Epoxide hydrolase N terminus
MPDRIGLNRRRFVGTVATTIAALQLGMAGRAQSKNASHAPSEGTPVTQLAQETAGDSTAITPFPPINIPEADLTDLRRRINATRWPDRELVDDQSQGIQLSLMQALATYWGSDYNWRTCETKLNAIPQFTTVIDGQKIHFMHVKSKLPNALPLIITHGWPGSSKRRLSIF